MNTSFLCVCVYVCTCVCSQLKRGNKLHTKQVEGLLGETEGQKERVTNGVNIISNNKDYYKN